MNDKQARIMEVIAAFDGHFETELGSVIHDIALLADVPYKTVSHELLNLEREGHVTITRWNHPDPRRANKLISVTTREPT